TRKITFDSSGDAAIEHGPPGRPAEVSAAAVQFAPPSVERNTPSSPQTSTMPWPVGPPPCTTTSQMSPAVSPGVGSTNVHVTPESVLTATPQFVPMKTLFAASGRMPNAVGCDLRNASQLYAAPGVAVAGCVQVAPPSVLTLIPAMLATRPSKNDVA